MWDFDIGRTLAIMVRTWPFIVLRMLVYFGITAAYIFATGTGAGVGYGVLAIVFAWAVKAALIEPFAIAALMSVYFKVIEGQTPNPEWDRRLSGASKQFRELKERALGAGSARSEGGAADPAG